MSGRGYRPSKGLIVTLAVIVAIPAFAWLMNPFGHHRIGNAVKKEVTKIELRQWKTAMQSYKQEYGAYPQGSTREILVILKGRNARKISFVEVPSTGKREELIVDMWGNPYMVRVVDADHVLLRSAGSGKSFSDARSIRDDIGEIDDSFTEAALPILPAQPIPWSESLLDVAFYLLFVGMFFGGLWMAFCVVMAPFHWRRPTVYVRRLSRLALFAGLLLFMSSLANAVWGCMIWGHLYVSTDYFIGDFIPFIPVTPGAVEMPFGGHRGGLLGSTTYAQLYCVWALFALVTWTVTIVSYRRLRRRGWFSEEFFDTDVYTGERSVLEK